MTVTFYHSWRFTEDCLCVSGTAGIPAILGGHCEERSDEAISYSMTGLLRFARNDVAYLSFMAVAQGESGGKNGR